MAWTKAPAPLLIRPTLGPEEHGCIAIDLAAATSSSTLSTEMMPA